MKLLRKDEQNYARVWYYDKRILQQQYPIEQNLRRKTNLAEIIEYITQYYYRVNVFVEALTI